MPIDPATLKAPYLTRETIRSQADAFRSAYWNNPLPVDVLAILEFDLAFEIRPVKQLLSDVDVDALLLADFQTMLVDQDEYMDDRYANRLRFSVAHELGHYVLHRGVWEGVPIDDAEAWIRFM
ncbi:MAG: hypothetical protein RRC34_14080 [Lentisphaeria bacterium]|nr:hypothetical protein [Lentisphaeria bacterium]